MTAVEQPLKSSNPGAAAPMAALRSIAFYLGYGLITIFWGTLSCACAWALPYRARFAFIIGAWTRMVLLWLRLTCGIRVRVSGRQHIPQNPCLVFAKHESTWETLYLQTLFAPQTTLIKRELLWIPFFGWAFALLRPIAIDRREPRSALRKLINEGRERLKAEIWVLVFPEGTRTEPGHLRDFQSGGPALAAGTEAPILVVTHNSGTCWPAHRFLKRPGTIDVRIAPPIETAGRSSRAILAESYALMKSELEAIKRPS